MASIETKLVISKVCIIDLNKENDNKILVTLYGKQRSEMSIGSIEIINEGKDEWYNTFNRVVYLTGSGDSFILPDTRVQVKIKDFFRCQLNGFVQFRFMPAKYRTGKIKTMNNEEKMICQITKISTEAISSEFTYLTIDELKEKKKSKMLNLNKKTKNEEDKKVIVKGKYGNTEIQTVKIEKIEREKKEKIDKKSSKILAFSESEELTESDSDNELTDENKKDNITVDDEMEENKHSDIIEMNRFINKDNIHLLKTCQVRNVELNFVSDINPDVSVITNKKFKIQKGERVWIYSFTPNFEAKNIKCYQEAVLKSSCFCFKLSNGFDVAFLEIDKI